MKDKENTLKELDNTVAELVKNLKQPIAVTRKMYSNRIFKIDNYQQRVRNILERFGSDN